MAKKIKANRPTGLALSAKAFQRVHHRPTSPRSVCPQALRQRHDPTLAQAIDNLQKLCQEHLDGRYDLDIIDIYQQPALAKGEQIIAAPDAGEKAPLPLRPVIGDMSNPGRILVVLGIVPAIDDKK